MKIQFLGGSTFVFKSDYGTMVLDPTDDKNIKLSPQAADVCVISDVRYANTEKVKADNEEKGLYVIDGQGEYEIDGIFVDVTAYHGRYMDEDKDLVVKIRIDGVTIIYLGYMNHPLTKKEIEKFNTVDVLIAPIATGDFLSYESLESVINVANPAIFIPSLYSEGGSHSAIENVASLEDYNKKFGKQTLEEEKILKVNSTDFSSDEDVPMRTVVLKKS
ncbi:MBL fold metallo-hydrolase [Candidatus Woesebacteria bacterium]|nr:MBL fold metallo-hydrolase [Candidatus Woesebacteria bacterium]